jgi:hypothetical protein
MGIHGPDIMRALVIGQGVATVAIIIIILLKYAKILMKRSYKRIRNPVPWHILTIAISYLLATGYICCSIIFRIGQPFTWRIPLAFLIFIFGDIAFTLMISHLNTQIDELYRF